MSGHGSTALAAVVVMLAVVGALELELNKGMVFEHQQDFVRYAGNCIAVLNIDLRAERKALTKLKDTMNVWFNDSRQITKSFLMEKVELMISEVIADLDAVAPNTPATRLQPRYLYQTPHDMHYVHKTIEQYERVGLLRNFTRPNFTHEIEDMVALAFIGPPEKDDEDYALTKMARSQVREIQAVAIYTGMTHVQARFRELELAVNDLRSEGRLTQGLVSKLQMMHIIEDLDKYVSRHTKLRLSAASSPNLDDPHSMADVLSFESLRDSQLQITLQFPLDDDDKFRLYRAVAVPFEAAPGHFVSVQPEPQFYAKSSKVHVTLTSDDLRHCRTRGWRTYCELRKPVHHGDEGATCAHAMFIGDELMVRKHCEVRVQTTMEPFLLKGKDGTVIYSLPPGQKCNVSGPGHSGTVVTGTGSLRLTYSHPAANQTVFHAEVLTAGGPMLLDDVFLAGPREPALQRYYQEPATIPSFRKSDLRRLMYQDMRVRAEDEAGFGALAVIGVVTLVFGVLATVGWLGVVVWRTDSVQRLRVWTRNRRTQLMSAAAPA